jgi:hypothetical protein
MKRLLWIAALLALARPVAAAPPTIITPAPITGYGVLNATNASALLSTLAVNAGGTAFPTENLPDGYIEVLNSVSSAGILYVCPFGGTCSTTVGYPLAVGQSKTFFIQAANGQFPGVTVIAASTAIAVVSW